MIVCFETQQIPGLLVHKEKSLRWRSEIYVNVVLNGKKVFNLEVIVYVYMQVFPQPKSVVLCASRIL